MRVNFFGKRSNDIVLYIARTLSALQERVLILDETSERSMKLFFPDIEGFDLLGNTLGYRGVDYAVCEGAVEAEYDYELVLKDEGALMEQYGIQSETVERTVVVCDELPENEHATDNCFLCLDGSLSDEARDEMRFVIRDYTGYVKEQFSNVKHIVRKEHIYRLPYSREDRKMELYAVYKGCFRLSSVSEQLSELIDAMIYDFRPFTTAKELRRAYKTAQKGGIA